LWYRSVVIRRPTLKPHLRAAAIDDTLAVLLSDVRHWSFRGPVYPRLLPLLDGTRSVPTIMEELRAYANVAEVSAALLILERSGYLTDAERRSSRVRAPRSAASLGSRPADPTAQLLNMFGLAVHAAGELTLAVTDDYLRRELAEFAVTAARANRAWLPLKSLGAVVWFGPLVHPPLTPCWDCLLERVRANRPAHAWLESRGRLSRRGAGAQTLPVMHHVAVRAASAQMLEWTKAQKAYESHSTLLTMDPDTLRTTRHVVIRQPDCPQCRRSLKERPPASGPIVLESRPRGRSTDGGWRSVQPERTFRQYRHHISELTGVVSRIRRRAVGSRPLDDYTADHLFAPTAGDPFTASRRVSAGKGISRAQARTSALCEALERYSGVFRGTEARVRASYQALGDAAIHPNACANFSDAQFDRRDVWNLQSHDRTWVPPRLNPGQDIEWTSLWSLTHERVRYVPTAYCYYGYRPAADEMCCRADSNGCAAGNNLEEAILQGFLELVERDAVAIWWYNELKRPSVDLATFPQSFFREMVADYKRNGRSLGVLDLTTDLAIPVFAAVSAASHSTHPLLIGFGAHLEPETAIARAITELNQWRCGAETGMPGAVFRNAGGNPGEFLRRSRSSMVRKRKDFRSTSHADIRDAVRFCVDRAAACGLETLVLDQTREDIGLSVVRVIVPGLRHFWPRFGPGRLYEVPLRLGWLPAARAENQLNICHILI
jgi:ribosomal protein S12 methylthiotransferase accessory factor